MTKNQPPTTNDYLWDPSAPEDSEVARAERLLRTLRTPLPPAPEIGRSPKGSRSVIQLGPYRTEREGLAERKYRGIRFAAPTLAAAAAIVLMVFAIWQSAFTARSWEVARLAGQPVIESKPVGDEARIAVGQALETDATSRARVHVSTIGQVIVEGNTRVRLVDTRQAHHKLALDRGTMHAFISAPPGQFIVDTPSATATDLGCVYTLHIDEDGSGLLSVTAGWVAFEYKGRESFVPAGASSRTDEQQGPGTPRYDDSGEAFRRALDRIDFDGDAAAKSDALGFVLEHARPRDAITLWHLIARVSAAERPHVIDALDERAPLPANVSREAVMRLDRAALDQWWDSLGLRDAGWWRKWKGAYPASTIK